MKQIVPLIQKRITHRNLILFGLLLMAIGLPLSAFLMSLGQFVLLGNWIIEGKWKDKWDRISKKKWFFFLLLFYFLHVVGMLWSEDFEYGIKDLRIKLPLFLMPLLLFTSEPIKENELKIILRLFVASVLISTLVSLFVFVGFTKHKVVDTREISIFISHIRLSLMVVLSCLLLLLNKLEVKKTVSVIVFLWFVFFLFLLESLTGILILIAVLLLLVLYLGYSRKNKVMVVSIFSVLVSVLLFVSYVFISEWKKLKYDCTKTPNQKYCFETPGKRRYFNDFKSQERENGNLVWTCIQIEELREGWNKRSKVNFDSMGHAKNPIASTIIRYLASKGQKKDSSALAQLSQDEITSVENGVTNFKYKDPGSIRSRIHEALWEYQKYQSGGDPTGHSLLMRIEFWRCAARVICNHLVFGAGTGDVKQELDRQYEKDNTRLPKAWRLRSHNQFFTTTVGLGIIGGLLLLLFFAIPFLTQKKPETIFVFFMCIVFLSMLNEDTLETQAGVTFFSFFYFLLLRFSTSSRVEDNYRASI